MPVIHTHVSVPTTPEQREALKAAYGKAITAVPGKSEGWLMCPFEDNMPIYFCGSDDQPAANCDTAATAHSGTVDHDGIHADYRRYIKFFCQTT